MMDIKRKAFESLNNVNPDWSFKFDEELQQYVATDFEMTNQVDEFNEHWDTFRAKWLRDAIDKKIELETGQSSSEHIEKSKNTTSTSVFKNVCRNLKSFWQALKKPDVSDRASSTAIHNHSGK